MSERVEGLAIRITQGNVGNSHIPVRQIAELFPRDVFGGGNDSALGVPIDVLLDGVGTFQTDIPEDKMILRMRSQDNVGKFYKLHDAKEGTRLFFERLGKRSFRVTAIN